jgi:7,8-dihydropterin-6-yl-methyl-4-(beta-D-ribofuranosyl)aminobenzene 5'-phosphate synthase
MKVTTLFENRTISSEYISKHGLSLYIETSNHKILFDTGVDDSFIYNAFKLGVNLEEVDIAIISHGHYDHGGGLEGFLKINSKAKIYIGKNAFDKHIKMIEGNLKHDIGLNSNLLPNDRFIFIEKLLNIDNELTLFAGIKGKKLVPIGNDKLLKEDNNGLVGKDDFEHEINLLINENQKYSLICGCAHKGIVNIIQGANDIVASNLKIIIGGFHLKGMDFSSSSTTDFLDELATILSSNSIEKYYTCHCTGEEAYGYLDKKMDNLNELKTGMVIDI